MITPLSRIEEILYSYNEGLTYTDQPKSRIEAIVLNLLFNTNYALKYPRSRIEEQLIELTDYTGNKLSRIEEILNIKINGGEYNKSLLSRVEILLMEYNPIPIDFEYFTIDDNLGNAILDSNNDALYGRVRAA